MRFEFPRIDVTIDVEGTKLDYSFYLEGYAYSSANSCNVMVSVSSAICREGDITLEGKRHHSSCSTITAMGVSTTRARFPRTPPGDGQLYPEPGDMLLIDPQTGGRLSIRRTMRPPAIFAAPLSEMISIDGRWYDLKISPAGDKLTLTPSTVPLGSVTNRNEAFRALIYGEGKGFLKICGTKDKPVPVPEGQWKLLSYTITHADHPAKPAEKARRKGARRQGREGEAGLALAARA